MGSQSHRLYLLDLLCGYHNDSKQGLYVQPIRSLLDVGCGTGPIYDLLAFDKRKFDSKWNSIEKYKGVDPSESMIESCQYHFPKGDFAVEDARHLTEEDDSWDCLLYMHSFDYLYEYKVAIRQMYRVTKKYVCIVLWQALGYGEGRTHGLNNTTTPMTIPENVDWDTARLQHFAWPLLKEEFKHAGFDLLLKKDDEEINKEGRQNTLLLFEKV